MSSLERLITQWLFTRICWSASVCSSAPQPTAKLENALYLVSPQGTKFLQDLINVSSGKHLFYQGLAISYIGVMKKQWHCRERTPVSTLPEIMGLRGGKKKKSSPLWTTVLSWTLCRTNWGRARRVQLHTAKPWCSASGITKSELIIAILD